MKPLKLLLRIVRPKDRHISPPPSALRRPSTKPTYPGLSLEHAENNFRSQKLHRLIVERPGNHIHVGVSV